MLAVISDLHLEEEARDAIPGKDGKPALVFRRNLDPKVYRSFISHMADEVARRGAREFELVIAGDLFDFNRTSLWFEDELRPYVALEDISGPLEEKLLRILEAIAAEPVVAEALECLRRLAEGRYRVARDDGRPGEERDFPAKKIKLHYLGGNHDRLSNATPRVRRRICELLGIDEVEQFPPYILRDDPGVLIRHGHEYDNTNFAIDYSKAETIPLDVPAEGYSQANFGDVITIDIAVRLPWLFRQRYGDEQIVRDRVLSSLYLRLLQFDDVRPQSALLDYVLDTSKGNFSPEEAWDKLVPVLDDLIDEVQKNKFFQHWLAKRARPWAPLELDAAEGLLKLGAWHNAASREIARKVAHFMLGGETDKPELFAAREDLIQQGNVRLVLSGHTHFPYVTLLSADETTERFYINTGTWRNSIPSSPDGRTFGRLRALTYVMLFNESEAKKEGAKHDASFDYWTGYTRDWSSK